VAFLALLRSNAAAVAFAAGLAVAAYGLSLVWTPLGVVSAGLALARCAILYQRGRDAEVTDA